MNGVVKEKLPSRAENCHYMQEIATTGREFSFSLETNWIPPYPFHLVIFEVSRSIIASILLAIFGAYHSGRSESTEKIEKLLKLGQKSDY